MGAFGKVRARFFWHVLFLGKQFCSSVDLSPLFVFKCLGAGCEEGMFSSESGCPLFCGLCWREWRCHPLSVKKGFTKGETLRLLRTNSIKEKFESSKRDFKFRLLERGYPQKLVNNIQAEVDFSSRNDALKYKPKTSKDILPFVTTYNPGVPKLKESLMKNWSLISNNPNLARIFPNAPIVAYKKDKSLKDLLVRAKIPPQP